MSAGTTCRPAPRILLVNWPWDFSVIAVWIVVAAIKIKNNGRFVNGGKNFRNEFLMFREKK